MRPARRIGASAVAALTLAATACGDTSGTAPVAAPIPAPSGDTAATQTDPPGPGEAASQPDPRATAEPPELLRLLCEAAAAEPEGARRAFATAHDEVHLLPRQLGETGYRSEAGDILEAKQRVEAAFASDPVPSDLRSRLTDLIDTVVVGLTAMGETPPPCPQATAAPRSTP